MNHLTDASWRRHLLDKPEPGDLRARGQGPGVRRGLLAYLMNRVESGHLFQGRYRAILADADRYLLALVRYIHLNPVPARIAAEPCDYPWSSHRCYLGQMRRVWLTTDWVLRTLGPTAKVATQHYAAFIQDQEAPSTALQFRTGSEHDEQITGCYI